MKPPADYEEDSVDTGFETYDGPPPTAGLYKGKVKKLLLQQVESGEKKGEQRILVICDITVGKFKGAGVAKWLQLTKQGSPWVNQFLRALTDGSDAAFADMRAGFKKGYACEGPDSKKRYSIEKFANKFVPIGKDINFFVTQRTIEGGERDGELVAQIARFVTPVNGTVSDDDEPDADDSFADALAEVADDPDTDDVSTDDDNVPDDDSDLSAGNDETGEPEDTDDPWSVDA
jgi:hypothetical protein